MVVLGEENNWILSPENLYKCATFYLFLSLHFAPEGLTWVGSVLSTKNPLVEKIVCKGTWCLNTAMLVSPHFKQFQCFHRNVSGFASSILSLPWLPEWLALEKRPGFDFYCNKLQRPFSLPRRGSYHIPYSDALHQANLETFSRRRQSITTKLFDSITCNSDHKLHELLPPRNNCESNLRRKRNFNVPLAKTKRLRTHLYMATVHFSYIFSHIFIRFYYCND